MTTITGAHRGSAGESVAGLLSLFFHPQRRVYGIWALWILTSIFVGPPYGGITMFSLQSSLCLILGVLASSIGALEKWKRYGMIGMIVGPTLVFVSSFVAQSLADSVRNTSYFIIYSLLLTPLVTAGYLISIFGALCVGYHAHVNRGSRLYNRSLALVLTVVGAVLIFFPVFLSNLHDLFTSMGLMIPGEVYHLSDFPFVLLFSINALYEIVLLVIVLFGAAVLYGVVDKKIGAVLFLIGIIIMLLPYLGPMVVGAYFTGFYSGVSLMAIGAVWIGGSLSELKRYHLSE